MQGHNKGWLRPVIDYGPLLVFFVCYWLGDLLTATAGLMAATVVALALSLAVERRVPPIPLVTAVIVMVFGGLTLWLHDDVFIKMKPTIVQVMFAAVLLAGLAMGKPLLKHLFGSAWRLDDLGWRILTIRFAVFFLSMAALNELVWRTQSTDFWVNFKVFGIILLTIVFTMTQLPLINRHHLPEEESDQPGD